MRFLLLLFLFFICSGVEGSVLPDSLNVSPLGAHRSGLKLSAVKSTAVKFDSSRVVLRHFDVQKLKEYSKQREFVYEAEKQLDLSIWTRFWHWFWRLFDGLIPDGGTGNVIKYLVIAALVGLLVFIVLKFKGISLMIFAKKSKEIDVPYHETDDNIHEINFENEIEQAVSQTNYRLAVRLLYLRSLKKLSDQELIDWQPGKTNQTYVNELTDQDKKTRFGKLTRLFEYVWYGEFFVDKAIFNQVRDTFEQFNVQQS